MNSQLTISYLRLRSSMPLAMTVAAFGLWLSYTSCEPHERTPFDETVDASSMTEMPKSEREIAIEESFSSGSAGEVVKIPPAEDSDISSPEEEHIRSSPLETAGESIRDKIAQYLWNAYQRSPTKRDSHGDFTWKDQSAAARLGMPMRDYVIGGMDPDFRELLYHAGLAMDLAGIHWTILSGFRDDYRQSIAAGLKAHPGNSFHGGSIATGGYGYGCAADLASADGVSNPDVWQWLAVHGAEFGLQRPLPAIDPAHVQPRGAWHELAATLRHDPTPHEDKDSGSPKPSKEHSGATTATAISGGDLAAGLEAACAHARLPVQQSKQTPSTRRRGLVSSTRPTEDASYPELSKLVGNDQFTVTMASRNTVASTTPKTRLTPGRFEHMWFIQLAGGDSQSVALAAYYRLQRKYNQILGAYRPLIMRASGNGYRWYRARIATNNRAIADKLCASLRAVGGDCLVYPQ